MTPELIILLTCCSIPIILVLVVLGRLVARSVWSSPVEKSTAPPTTVTIAERVGCLGMYKGKEIPEFIILDDDRKFEYVSLALKKENEVYIVKADLPHIKVDERLLYRQVPTSADK